MTEVEGYFKQLVLRNRILLMAFLVISFVSIAVLHTFTPPQKDVSGRDRYGSDSGGYLGESCWARGRGGFGPVLENELEKLYIGIFRGSMSLI